MELKTAVFYELYVDEKIKCTYISRHIGELLQIKAMIGVLL